MFNAYVNGQWIQAEEKVLPVDERGHQFGDGVYEVVRIYDGKPFMMEEHLTRLLKSAEAIKINVEETIEDFSNLFLEAIEKSGESNCDIYIQITRGIVRRNHLFPKDVKPSITMTIRPMEVTSMAVREEGKKVIFLEDERWKNCYIKSLNLLPNILAKQAAFEAGAFEAALYTDEYITEGSSSNIYIVKDGHVQTTPLSRSILAGITRQRVKQLSEEQGIEFIEESFTKQQMLEADEAFLTSTTNEIMPIVQIEDTVLGSGKMGPVTKQLVEAFFEKIK